MKSKYACPVSQFHSWYSRLGLNKYAIGSLLGVIGLIFLFLGSYFGGLMTAIIIATTSGIILKSTLSPVIELQLLRIFIFNFSLLYPWTFPSLYCL